MTPAEQSIDNSADVIDSRDVIARIEYLQSLTHDDDGNRRTLDSADAEELDALVALAAEAEPYAEDWQYGETLIRDSYFEDYARELADDIGAVPSGASWPANYIDWPAAARALQQDYSSVEFDGVTYWVR